MAPAPLDNELDRGTPVVTGDVRRTMRREFGRRDGGQRSIHEPNGRAVMMDVNDCTGDRHGDSSRPAGGGGAPRK